jgi:hypothetical protein
MLYDNSIFHLFQMIESKMPRKDKVFWECGSLDREDGTHKRGALERNVISDWFPDTLLLFITGVSAVITALI